MAEYLPPTEDLPKFNEFVFDDAYSIEGLDRRVVHKAGTETITGNKTFTGAVNIDGTFNITTDIVADKPSFDITNTGGDMVLNPTGDFQIQRAGVPKITATTNETYIQTTLAGSIYAEVAGVNKIEVNNTTTTLTNDGITLTTTGTNTLTSSVGGFAYGNDINCSGTGSNKMTTTSGDNYISAGGAGVNTIITGTGVNNLSSGSSSAISNKLENTSTGGNTIRVLTGTNTIQNTGGLNLMTALTTGTNSIISASATALANLIDAITALGGNTIRTTTGTNTIQNTGGSNLMTALTTGTNTIQSVSGANTIQNTGGSNIMNALTTGTNTIQSVSGANNITSTTGQIKLSTAGVLTTSMLIENTNATTGGITLRTSGTSGDIVLKSTQVEFQDNSTDTHYTQTSTQTTITNTTTVIETNDLIDIATFTESQVSINGGLGTEGYYLGVSGALTAPLISFALTLVPQDYNTTNSQLLIGYPNADIGNVVNSIRFPYRTRVVGWSVSGDTESHSALNLTLTVGTALSGAVTRYFRQTGTLAASAIQSNSATADILGNGSNMTSITTANDAEIPSGTRVYFYENTSATMACEMMFVVYFSQVI
jgi:hypothetical protein